MSTNTVDSLLVSSQSQCRSEMAENQGDTPREKEEMERLQHRVKQSKRNLTKAIEGFVSKITYYKTKFPTDDKVEIISTKIDCARDILKAQERATDRYIKLENALDELRNLLSDTWEQNEDELETALCKHTSEFLKYEKDFLEMNRKNDATVERCKALLIKSALVNQSQSGTAPVTNETRSTGGARAQLTFKPQSDL